MPNLIAIDPGVGGGIACTIDGHIQAWRMPETQTDLLMLIRGINKDVSACYIEDIPKYVGNAVPSSAIGVMFENFGYTKGVLQTLGIRTIAVIPRTWQKPFGLGRKDTLRAPKESTAEERATIRKHNEQAKRDWKNKLKAEAQRRFPQLTVTLNTCDALLILDYGKQAEGYREVEQATPFALK